MSNNFKKQQFKNDPFDSDDEQPNPKQRMYKKCDRCGGGCRAEYKICGTCKMNDRDARELEIENNKPIVCNRCPNKIKKEELESFHISRCCSKCNIKIEEHIRQRELRNNFISEQPPVLKQAIPLKELAVLVQLSPCWNYSYKKG